MCRCLRVQPSGFYAWLKDPLSKRAQEDHRQAELIRAAWRESGKVYGYRKLHGCGNGLFRVQNAFLATSSRPGMA
jgi:hypothetical protein